MAVLLADIVLVVHAGIAAFIVGGLPAIWAGVAAGWDWVRNPWFRAAHLGTIVFVALQSLAGRLCPLTVWEDWLRGAGPREQGFIERHLEALLYWDLPFHAFTALYVAFALAVALTWWYAPPRRLRWRASRAP
jgi:hypothetical protein